MRSLALVSPHEWTAPPVDFTATGTSNLVLGYTIQQEHVDSSTTRSLLDAAVTVLNQHIMNFGASTPSQGATTDGGSTLAAAGEFQPPGPPWFNFTTDLDAIVGTSAAVGAMRSADARSITFYGCPIWMRKPKTGSTYVPPVGSATAPYAPYADGGAGLSAGDHEPPHPDYFAEYAALCAEIADRYPHVENFEVWNEMKGFYASNLDGGRYAYELYTQMYNAIYTAVKAVRADAHIGGPYVVMTSYGWDQSSKWADDAEPDVLNRVNGDWGYMDKEALAVVRYWLENCTGADGIILDLRNTNKDYEAIDYWPIATGTQDNKWRGTPPAAPTRNGADPYYDAGYYHMDDPWDSSAKNGAIIGWIDAVIESIIVTDPTRTWLRDLPVQMGEWYANSEVNKDVSGAYNGQTVDFSDIPADSVTKMLSVYAWNLIAAVEDGVGQLLLWKPDGDADGRANNDLGGGSNLGLYNSSSVATPLAAVLGYFKDHFSAGTAIQVSASTNVNVRALVSETKVLLVSRSASNQAVSVAGTNYTLTPYEVRLVDR